MKIDDLIIELIQENKNVIIPGLGSFIKSEGKGSYTILFNEYLKYNDGLLQNKIQQLSSCSKEDAMLRITEFSDLVLNQLQNGKSYKIEGLGEFFLKAEKIAFEYSAHQEIDNLIRVEEPVATEDTVEIEEEEIEPTILDDIKEAQKQGIDPIVTEGSLQQEEVSEENFSHEEAMNPSEDVQEAENTTNEQNTIQADHRDESSSENSKNSVPKKKGKWMLWVGMVCIVCGISLLVWIQRDSLAEMFKSDDVDLAINNPNAPVDIESYETQADSAKNEVSVLSNEQVSDTTKDMVKNEVDSIPVENEPIDSSSIELPIETDEVLASTNTETSAESSYNQTTKRYHIVGGSFSSEQNADQFVRTLKESGYSNALVIGQRNGLYTVSFGGYEEKEKAKAQADRILEEGKFQGAWILYY